MTTKEKTFTKREAEILQQLVITELNVVSEKISELYKVIEEGNDTLLLRNYLIEIVQRRKKYYELLVKLARQFREELLK